MQAQRPSTGGSRLGHVVARPGHRGRPTTSPPDGRDELAQAHAQLARQKSFRDALLETIQVGVVSCDADGVIVISNRAEREIFGLERGLDGLTPTDLAPLIVAWDADGRPLVPDTYPLLRALRGESVTPVDVTVGPEGGPQREIVVRASQIRRADGAVLGAVAALTDVTAERAAIRALVAEQRNLAEARAFSDAILAASPDTTVVTDLSSGEIVYTSPGQDILGFAAEDFVALGLEGRIALVHPDDHRVVADLATEVRTLEDGQTAQARYRTQDATGQERWIDRRVTPFRRDEAGALVQALAVVRDVTELVHAEVALKRAAHHDSLTGLPNRAQLVEILGAALARAADTGSEAAVLFIDLDGFKQVNDTGGHSAGDVVLRETADRLDRIVRPYDEVARVGGDEFVIVVHPRKRAGDPEDPDVRACAASLAARVAEAVGQPITVRGIDHRVTASIGITFSGGSAGATGPTSVDDVLHLADAAMYLAKEQGKNRYEVLDARAAGAGPVSLRRPRARGAGRWHCR